MITPHFLEGVREEDLRVNDHCLMACAARNVHGFTLIVPGAGRALLNVAGIVRRSRSSARAECSHTR